MTAESTWSHADEVVRARQIRGFAIMLAMVLAAEYWSRALQRWEHLDGFLIAAVAAVSFFSALAGATAWRRLGFAGLSITLAAVVIRFFPASGNHEYLGLVFCLLCLFLDPRRPGESALFVDAIRWLVCVVLFWAGIQKVVHGLYFEGEYLAYSLSRESYGSVFAWLLPAPELTRLAAYGGEVGSGPYRADGLAFLIVSNLTYAAEIALVAGLLWRRTRKLALAVTLALLIAIQSAAREVFFALVLGNALLLFLDSDVNRRLIGPLALLLAGLLLMRAGLLPEVTFS
jgi:hypothetical protein